MRETRKGDQGKESKNTGERREEERDRQRVRETESKLGK